MASTLRSVWRTLFRQPPEDLVEIEILTSLVRREEPEMSVMEVSRTLAARFGFDDWREISSATTYPALFRMEREGLLGMRMRVPDDPERPVRERRFHYSLTVPGRRLAERILARPASLPPLRIGRADRDPDSRMRRLRSATGLQRP